MPLIAWFVTCIIWGTTWLFLKLGLHDLPPVSFATIRVLISALALSIVVAIRRTPLPRAIGDWCLISITGTLFFAINYALIFWGGQHISAGLGALLASTVPLFGLLVAHHQVPGDGITRRKLAGVLFGVAGVGVIFSGQLGIKSSSAIWGGAAVLLGSFCVALAAVLVKSRGAHLDRGILMAGQMCFALLPLSVIGLIAEGNPLRFNWTSMSLASVIYMALMGTVLAGLMFNWLVKKIAVTKTMLIFLVVPLVAVSLGILFLGERLTFPIAIGGTGILVGVGLIAIRSDKRAAIAMLASYRPNDRR